MKSPQRSQVAVRGAVAAARRLLLAQPRQRRLAVEQGAEGRAVGVHLQQQRILQRRVLGPGIVQLGEAVGIVGVDRGAALDQRAFAAQRRIDAGARADALDEDVRLLVARAQGERPGRGQHQARPPVDFLRRQPGQPFEDGALAALRHQRFVEAALGQVVGGFAAAGGERVQRRRLDPADPGQAFRGAFVQRCLLIGRQGGEALAAAPRAPGHACAATRWLRWRRRSACRRPGGPAAPRRPPRPRRAPQSSGWSGSRMAMRVRKATSAGSRLASSRPTKRSRSAPRFSAISERSKRGSPAAAIAERASCRPSGQPSASSCRRAAASRSTAAAEAGPHQLDRLLEAEAQLRRADDDAVAVGDQVVDLEAAVGPRRRHRAQVRRRVAQQVGQGLARRLRQVVDLVDEEDDVERRVRHLGEPDGHAFQPGGGAGGEQGVAEGRPAGAGAHRERQALEEARRLVVRPAPTARRRSGRAPGARGATAPSARSCRSPPAPAPG